MLELLAEYDDFLVQHIQNIEKVTVVMQTICLEIYVKNFLD